MIGQNIGNKVYNFIEYKKNKPFFLKPMKIMVETPEKDTYYLIKNVVYKGKQILALKKDNDPNTIILVEANIHDGQLKYISMLPDEYVKDICGILKGTIGF
ncbi:hypothetical protein HPT25_18735 [Bacillus sp. BRMEA1]|nr:hypothetical protein [Neobacillus endophyticus]